MAVVRCTEKAALLFAYTDRVTTYRETVTVLQNLLGKVDPLELEKLTAVAAGARALTEAARLEMDAHVAKHGC